VAILGTPGGSRIITMVLLGILDLEAGHGPASWVARPRFHHQYLPDLIEYEPEAFSDEVLEIYQDSVQGARTWFGVEESFTGYAGFVRIGARRGFHLLLVEETDGGFSPLI